MQVFQREFIDFILSHNALAFGNFTLKSGRKSPYFFNMGVFHDGAALEKIGQFYAATIANSPLQFDVLFGPAYKGIPLACSTAMALTKKNNQPILYAFNRKEAKDHGEGGNIIGTPLKGKILIIDDVITAGTAIREAMRYIENAGAKLGGIIVALDRQERGQKNISAIQEIEQLYQVPGISIIKFEHLLEYLAPDKTMHTTLQQMQQYRETYGVT